MFPRASCSVCSRLWLYSDRTIQGIGKWRTIIGLHVVADRLRGPDEPSFSSSSVPALLCSQQPKLTGTIEGTPPIQHTLSSLSWLRWCPHLQDNWVVSKAAAGARPRFSWTGLVAVSLSPAILRLVKSSFLHPIPWKGCFPD